MSVRLELLTAWCYKLLLKFCSYKQTLKTIGDILEIYDQRQVPGNPLGRAFSNPQEP